MGVRRNIAGRSLALAGLRTLSLVFFVLVLVFALFSILPADPVRSLLGPHTTEAAVGALRQEFGLDQPLHVRFVAYLKGVVTMDFGRSFVTRRPVAPDVAVAFRNTLVYVSGALLLACLYSVLSSFVVTLRPPGSLRVVEALNGIFTSVPSLVVAVGIGVALLLTGLPPFVPVEYHRTVAASVALAIYPACTLSQILIHQMARLRHSTHVRAIRSFGYSELRLFCRTLLPGALPPWLAQLSNVAASLVAGSIVVEVVFSLPGLGRLVLQSVLRSDLPMIQAVVLMTAVSFLLLDGCMELVYRRYIRSYNV
jgi:peptide/nickel transport system permease protein